MTLHSLIDSPPPTSKFDLLSFQKHVQTFLLDGSYRNLSPHTLEYYYYHLLGLQRFLTARDETLDSSTFSALVGTMLNDMSNQGRAHWTMRGRYNTCRLFFRFLYPTETWQSLDIPDARNHSIEPEKLLTFCDYQLELILQQPNLRTFTGWRDYTIMLVLLDTGIRISELSRLKASDIDMQDQTIRIVLGKGQKSRNVPIQKTCIESLASYLQLRGTPICESLWITRRGTPYSRASIIQMIRHYCRNAKLIGVRGSAHTFRHTMAKKFLLNGGSVYALQRILGHSTLDITRHYVDLLQIDLHTQHEKWSPVESLLAYANKMNNEEESCTWK